MAELEPNVLLERAAPACVSWKRDDCELEFEPFLGVAKVQLLPGPSEKKLAALLGADLPAPCREVAAGPIWCAWLAPGEWLLTGTHQDFASVVDAAAGICGATGMAINLTHARASFLLTGQAARDALAAHSPLDFSHSAMPVGTATRSLLGDAGVFISRKADRDDAPVFRVIVDQIHADYAARMLAGPNCVTGASS
jgi:sarcosine oxidase subunit gamma